MPKLAQNAFGNLIPQLFKHIMPRACPIMIKVLNLSEQNLEAGFWNRKTSAALTGAFFELLFRTLQSLDRRISIVF
jgi:hypothetical protein